MKAVSHKQKGESGAPEVEPDTALKAVMALQLESGMPVYVREKGNITGRIDIEAVHATLLR
jgi:hypothetical protein